MKRIVTFFLIAGLLPSFVSAEFGLGLPGVIKKRVERLDQRVSEMKPQPKSWGQAIPIETENAGNASSPQVALDTAGNAIAVWHQSDGTRDNIWANRYSQSTGTWSTATVIGTNTGNAYFPQVALDTSGNGIAVWNQYDGTRDNIWANRYVSGTGWGSATPIETDNAGNAYYPQVALDTSGNGIAVWNQYDGTRDSIWANRYVSGTGWGSATLIEGDTGNAEYPQVALDTSGNGIAVWYQYDGTRYNIWYR
ncbi:MAG: hypothetical protein V2A53_09230 [bacterium]